MFWKKEEIPPPEQPPSFDIPSPLEPPRLEELPKDVPDFAKEQFPPQQFGAPPIQPAFGAPGPTPSDHDKEFQLINAKLDAIRATLDAITQRLERIERTKLEEPAIKWR